MSIIYFDTSALVKKYIKELGSDQISESYSRAELIGTAMITPPEMASALSRAIRRKVIDDDAAGEAWNMFGKDWDTYIVIDVTQALIGQASKLVWEQGLRGYDAVHLASLLAWKDALGMDIALATFDVELWEAAKRLNIHVIPEILPNS
ncbi:MAG: type II toxin-antitoxin system VapC family toxin [Anaerolineales bacterium]|nr:type II toxin-antitoxin system VapC family toxin [Anaerolineales bacterium]